MARLGISLSILRLERVDHVLDKHRDLLDVDRALVAGGADGVQEFLPVELLAAAVALDDHHAVADQGLGGGDSGGRIRGTRGGGGWCCPPC